MLSSILNAIICGGRAITLIVFCAAMIAAFTSTAEAGLREQCAASTGASSGAAFSSCMTAGKADSPQQKKPLYKDPGSRGRCRMGNC
jgi:hypothetical protein